MAVYGLNFNSVHIPPGYKRWFREFIKIAWLPRGHRYRLQGVCDSKTDMHMMLIQADNGHRLLHVETRKTGGPILYGIYSY